MVRAFFVLLFCVVALLDVQDCDFFEWLISNVAPPF